MIRSHKLRLFVSSVVSVLLLATPIANAETFEQALISAYQNHPKLQGERARLREFDENYVQAQAQSRMTSNLSGSLTTNVSRTPALNIPGFDSFIASGTDVSTPGALQLQVIQPIYQGGRVSALKSQVKSSILAAREGLRATETEILVNVANAYVHVLRDEEAARIRRSNVSVLMHQKEAADTRFEVGAGTRTDMALSEARLAGAKVGLAQAAAQLQTSRAQYRELTGHMPENLQPLPRFALPITEDEAVRLAKANNPGLLASALQEEAGEAAISVAKAAKKPVISLNATAGGVRWQSGYPDHAETATIGAQVTVPILSGGMNRSRIRAAKSARTRLMFETRDVERQLYSAIMQNWAGLQAAQEALDASQVQVAAAELALEGVELEREVGTRNALDVLNAEQELLDAQLVILNSRTEVEKAGYRLLALTGAFDAISLSLPTDYYDPNDNLEDVKSDNFLGIVEEIIPAKWR